MFLMKLVLLMMSITYLVVEVIFNVNLVNIIEQGNFHDHPDIEVYGRHIASIGSSILFIKLLSKLLKGKALKASFILIPIFYIFVFIGQKEFIEYVARSTPVMTKYNSVFISLYQKDFRDNNAGVNYFGIDKPKYASAEQSKVFISSLGILAAGYSNYNREIDKEEIIKGLNHILAEDLAKYPFKYRDKAESARKHYQEYVNSYMKIEKEIESNYAYEEPRLWNEMQKGKEELIESNREATGLIRYRKVQTHTWYVQKMRSLFINYLKCTTIHCQQKVGNKIDEFYVDVDKEFPEYNFHKVTIQNSCKFDNNGSTSKIISGETVLDKKYDTHVKTYTVKSRMRGFSNYSRAICNIDLRPWLNIVLRETKKEILAKSGIARYNYKNTTEFINKGFLDEALINKAKEKGLTLPRNWKYHDRNGFSKTVRIKIERKAKKELNSFFGYNSNVRLPLYMTEQEFHRNKDVIDYAKDKMGLYYSRHIYIKGEISDENLIYHLRSSFLLNSFDTLIESLKDESKLNRYFISVISPVFAMFMSLIFGALNFILIAVTLSEIFLSKESIRKNHRKISDNSSHISLSIGIFLAAVFLLVPIINPNPYMLEKGFSNLIDGLHAKHEYLAYLYEWFLSFESVIYTLAS